MNRLSIDTMLGSDPSASLKRTRSMPMQRDLALDTPETGKSPSRVHFSSATDEWATPQALFDELSWIFGGFTLDPCATPENAKCERFFTRKEDGLSQPWTGKVFLNPPYGREIGRWVQKAFENR